MVCQLDSLRPCLRLDALRKVLNTLPKTLDDTYERIISKIDEEYEDDALRIFEWLCYSERPMRLVEMAEVLAIDLTSDAGFRPERRLRDPHDILAICSSLISVTAAAENPELRLAHFSVKEYLISDRLRKTSMHRYQITPSYANLSMVKTCLTYLLYFKSSNFWMTHHEEEFPLIEYAAGLWTWHYRQITSDTDREAVDVLACKFVESKNSCFINWGQDHQPRPSEVFHSIPHQSQYEYKKISIVLHV